MTTLAHTSSKVARNSTLSDLSFRAILLVLDCGAKAKTLWSRQWGYTQLRGVARGVEQHLQLRERTHRRNSQQSSVSSGWGHQLHRPGQPVFPAASSPPLKPTDDCSLFPRRIRLL